MKGAPCLTSAGLPLSPATGPCSVFLPPLPPPSRWRPSRVLCGLPSRPLEQSAPPPARASLSPCGWVARCPVSCPQPDSVCSPVGVLSWAPSGHMARAHQQDPSAETSHHRNPGSTGKALSLHTEGRRPGGRGDPGPAPGLPVPLPGGAGWFWAPPGSRGYVGVWSWVPGPAVLL